jgi:25S rRNA (cytosine2278-C5)-methyltransferase
MNFYKECATILARLEEKKGSIKSLVGTMPEKDRKRAAALVIETLKCNKPFEFVLRQAYL